jgi:hypothetical protein
MAIILIIFSPSILTNALYYTYYIYFGQVGRACPSSAIVYLEVLLSALMRKIVICLISKKMKVAHQL